MKSKTRFLKQFGKFLFGSSCNVEHRKQKIVREYDVIKSKGSDKLIAHIDHCYGRINFFQEGARIDNPKYAIPMSYLEDELVEFTKCPECGNAAIIPLIGKIRRGTCIEPPNYHGWVVDEKGGG